MGVDRTAEPDDLLRGDPLEHERRPQHPRRAARRDRAGRDLRRAAVGHPGHDLHARGQSELRGDTGADLTDDRARGNQLRQGAGGYTGGGQQLVRPAGSGRVDPRLERVRGVQASRDRVEAAPTGRPVTAVIRAACAAPRWSA